MSDDRNSSIGWFLAGLGLGAAVGILYAPKSGRETRENLLERADEGRDFVTQRGREARERHQGAELDAEEDSTGRERRQGEHAARERRARAVALLPCAPCGAPCPTY